MIKEPLHLPCADWSETLATTHLADLFPSDWEAFNIHVQSCSECAAFRAEYRFVENQLRRLPVVEPLPDLPPQLLFLWEVQDHVAANNLHPQPKFAIRAPHMIPIIHLATDKKWLASAAALTIVIAAALRVKQVMRRKTLRSEGMLKSVEGA